MKSRILTVASFLLICGSHTAFAKNTKTIKWKMAHTPAEFFVNTANYFKGEVEKNSGGKLTVEVIVPKGNYESSTDARDDEGREIMKEFQSGEVQMTQLTTRNFREQIPEMKVFDAYGLFSSEKHVETFVNSSVAENVLAKTTITPFTGLGFTYSGGELVLPVDKTKLGKITKVEDFKKVIIKGRDDYFAEKFGVRNIIVYENGHRLSGGRAFRSGYSNSQEATFNDSLLNFSINNTVVDKNNILINETRHRYLFTVLAINTKFFNSLSKQEQKWVRDAATKAAYFERELIRADNKKAKDFFQKEGVEICKLPQDQFVKLRKMSRGFLVSGFGAKSQEVKFFDTILDMDKDKSVALSH